MKIETFKIEKSPRVTDKPFLRASLDGTGCSIETCSCSAPFFVTLSDGKTGIKAELTHAEAKAILKGWASLT